MSTDVVVVVFIFSVDGVVGLASASSNFQVYNEWHRRTLLPSSLAERKPFRALSLATSKRLCAHVNRRMNECFQCTQRTQKELRIDSGVVSRGCVVVGGDGGETKNYVPKWRMCGTAAANVKNGKVCFGVARAHKTVVAGHIILFSICANNAIKYHLYLGSLSHRAQVQSTSIHQCGCSLLARVRIVSDFRCTRIFRISAFSGLRVR